MAKKISIAEEFKGTAGETYIVFRIGAGEACCVKKKDSGLIYVMDCFDGKEVYSYIGGIDFPLRMLTDAERKTIIARCQ